MDNDIMFKSKGVFKYEGEDRLVVIADQQLSNYYRSLIPKCYPVNRPRWPAHITVVRAGKEVPINVEHWGRYDKEVVEFNYSPVVHTGKVYYWLNIFCNRLEEIREELGLPVRSQFTQPPEGFKKAFHMTIANMKD